VRFDVIMAPEIQRDKRQDKDKSARHESRTHRSTPRLQVGTVGIL
jgi:hypothetical protein